MLIFVWDVPRVTLDAQESDVEDVITSEAFDELSSDQAALRRHCREWVASRPPAPTDVLEIELETQRMPGKE